MDGNFSEIFRVVAYEHRQGPVRPTHKPSAVNHFLRGSLSGMATITGSGHFPAPSNTGAMAGGLRCGCKGMLIMEQEPTPQEYATIDAHQVRKRGVAIKVPFKSVSGGRQNTFGSLQSSAAPLAIEIHHTEAMPRRIFILLCDTGRRVDRFPVPLLQRFEHWATMPTEQALRNMQVIDRVMILQVVPSRLFQLFESSYETCRKVARPAPGQ